ncbi:YtpI family protein [Paenibacillus turpanensis]|uniref:YtpI family protein n=1 Tax=Paenibacillus turpanensis TaxID=2689078 RepID=UPI001FB80E5C|nr:YtpI family protein [Paenibacillus turpanensis]
MLEWISRILVIVIAVFSALSIYYSVMSRRAADMTRKAQLSSKMNICMGSMLIAVSAVQLVLFEESKVRSVVGIVFLLLGLFNLFAGIRNLSLLRTADKQQQQQ